MRKSGWVDITTNVISQHEMSLSLMLECLENNRPFPTKYFPLLIHEITHHWCFASAVGNSLFLLRERAASLMAHTDINSPRTGQLLCQTVMRYNVAMSILAPLIEGIALFSEFDSLLGGSRSLSSPSSACFVLFLPRDIRDIDNLKDSWRQVRRSLRISDEGIARKALVLSGPLGLTPRADYLRGYLCVRSLYRRALLRNEQFRDSDFFLTYFRHVFFGDCKLASLLLEQSTEVESWIRRFFGYIMTKIHWIVDDQERIITDEFDKLVAGETYNAQSHGHLVGILKEDYREWEEIIERWKRDPTDGLAEPSSIKDWPTRLTAMVLYRSSVVRLATGRAAIRISRDNHVYIDGRDYGHKDVDIPIATDEGVGSVTLYYIELVGFVLLAELNRKVVRTIFPPDLLAREDGEAILAAVKLFHDMESIGLYGEDDPVQLGNMVDYCVELPNVMQSVERHSAAFWNDIALDRVEASRRETVAKDMEVAGFGQLLDKSNFLVDGLSTISAFSACSSTVEDLRTHLSGKGVELQEVVSCLRDHEERSGFRFFEYVPMGDMSRATLHSFV
jgi:hypothetical protein